MFLTLWMDRWELAGFHCSQSNCGDFLIDVIVSILLIALLTYRLWLLAVIADPYP